MKHTPTPWKIVGGCCIFDEAVGLRRIASCTEYYSSETYPREQSKANATFIVEACNAYEGLKKERDGLLKAAQVLVDALNAGGIGPLYDQTDALEKAIALCEGGKE